MQETKLIYSEALLRRAVFAFWWRTLGIGFPIALVFGAMSLWLSARLGSASWLVGALAALLVLAALFPLILYVTHYRNTLGRFREMIHPQALFRAEEASFTVISDIGSATLPWSAIKEVWRFPGFWLLMYTRAQFSTLPLAGIAPEMRALILERVCAAGGKVGGLESK